MGFIKEFKEFAMKGNVVDLAIGVVIGGAFGAIVKSLIDDVITPLILSPALKAANLSNIQDLKIGAIKYGSFLSSVISFFIIALVLFIIIKGVNRMKMGADEVVAAPTASETLLTEIRDLLKK
jgi:large conductance mechanosensitive channel